MWYKAEPIIHFGWMRQSVADSLQRYQGQVTIHQYGNPMSNIVVRDKGWVSGAQFAETLTKYRVGIIDYPSEVQNERLCAPTKLFDYLKFGIMPVCIHSDHLLRYWFKDLGVGCTLDQLINGFQIPARRDLVEIYRDRRNKRISAIDEIRSLIK